MPCCRSRKFPHSKIDDLCKFTHFEQKGLLVDKLLNLEVVLPVGLTADDAAVEGKRILKQQMTMDEM